MTAVNDFWDAFDTAKGELERERQVERLPVFEKGKALGSVTMSGLADYFEEYHDYLAEKHGFRKFFG